MSEGVYLGQTEQSVVAKLWQDAEAAGMSPQDFIRGVIEAMSAGISVRAPVVEVAQDNERVLVTAPSGFVVDLTPMPRSVVEEAKAFFCEGGPGYLDSGLEERTLLGMEEAYGS